MINVLFFAALRDAVGCERETLALPEGVTTVAELRAHLAARGGDWVALAPGRNVRAAVNQTMAFDATSLADGDEVALFPPVTGG